MTIHSLHAAGEVPGLVNYQGRLTDASGQPLSNGTYQVQFKLFPDPIASSTLIWGATYTNVAVVNGQFNVVLGALGKSQITGGAVTDIGLAFNAPERFLELSFILGTTTNTILPRQQILSAPFALQAGNVADHAISAEKIRGDVGVWTKSGSQISYTNGHVGIGTATPRTPLDVYGTAIFANNHTDGGVLMVFDLERSWELRQSGSGSGTALELASQGGSGNKNFIINTTGTLDVRGSAAVVGTVNGAAFVATADAGASGVVAKGQYYHDNGIVAWGRVDLNGNLIEDYGVSSVTKPSDGTFNVTIDTAMASAAGMSMSVTPIGTSPRMVAVQVTSTRTFTVRLYQVTAQIGPQLSATDFSFIVTGR